MGLLRKARVTAWIGACDINNISNVLESLARTDQHLRFGVPFAHHLLNMGEITMIQGQGKRWRGKETGTTRSGVICRYINVFQHLICLHTFMRPDAVLLGPCYCMYVRSKLRGGKQGLGLATLWMYVACGIIIVLIVLLQLPPCDIFN